MQTSINLSVPFDALVEAIRTLSVEEKESLVALIQAQIEAETEDATEELLKIDGFTEMLAQGEQDIVDGNVTEWRQVRQEV